ncbi:MAG: HD domain-containing protein [Lachnospiraceae bacterium]|nr:HD domain-containing protein [Lachnospiraceae bacterium]
MSKSNMERVQRILAHPFYKECVSAIATYEKDRQFCGHDMVHFLNVARIAMILNLKENKKPIRKDVVYAAALLHDMGRHIQYENGRDHAEASAELALRVLGECGYSEKETARIVEAIANHRNKSIKKGSDLKGILYRADKASRACYSCPVEAECNWKKSKKNMTLEI